MPDPYLVPCGVVLRAEFNALAPNRDRASDGWIGDAAHQKEHSDHNPDSEGAVRAIDVDNNLNVPDLSFEDVIQYILSRCRSGAEKRITYIIYYRRIWEQNNDWKQRTYTGSSQHTEHAHFSFSHSDKLANSTAPFRLGEMTMELSQGSLDKIAAIVNAPFIDRDATGLVETTVGHDALSQQVPDVTQEGSPQVAYYVAFENLGKKVVAMDAKLDAIYAAIKGSK